MEAHVSGSGGHRRRLVSEWQRPGKDRLPVPAGWRVGRPANRLERMGERIDYAIFPNRRAAVQVWLQVVVGQTAEFGGVRLDVPRFRRAEPAGVSKGRADCGLHGMGHSRQLHGEGAVPLGFSGCRGRQGLRRRGALMLLENKVALITGSGRGIGRAMAKLFAKEGASVFLTARTESELAGTAKEIASRGGKAGFSTADLTKVGDWERGFAVAWSTFA